MVGIAISFDLGRYHATTWGAHVNEATVEWPPSPWRLLRALYAVSLTNTYLADTRADLERALTRLARAQPPSFQLPPSSGGHTRHYVPLASHSPTKPGETRLLIDAFRALRPSDELRAWWDVKLDDAAVAALDATARAVGYLGRSESVCSMHVLREREGHECDAVPLTELDDASVREDSARIDLLALSADLDDPLVVLGTSVTDLRRRRMLVPAGTRWVTYALSRETQVPVAARRSSTRLPTIAHLRVAGGARPALTDAVTVGHLLRAALQRRLDPERRGVRSPVFSGHDELGPRRDQHAHAHYLALPGRDRRRVEHLFVWAPEGFGEQEVAAIAALRELRMRDAPEPFRVALVALGAPDNLRLPQLVGPHTSWRSVTPLALTRHAKRRGGRVVDTAEDQVLRELALRSFPPPSEIELVPGAWMRFRATRPGSSRRAAPAVVGVRLRFADPVRGPIALGGLSHFGFGLLAPDPR